MPLATSITGTTVGPRVFELQARHAMAYAAALGDLNPAYFDDTRPHGVVAPPLFGVRLDWPLRPFRAGTAGLTADDVRRGVHATHDMIFHRPARPGDRLTTTGRVVTAEPRTPGAYLLTRYHTVDAAGSPVLTTWYGSLFRAVPCHGDAQVLEAPPPLPAPLTSPLPATDATSNTAVPAGASSPRRGGGQGEGSTWTADIHVPREMPHLYTECADIWNPIHTERAVALAAGLPDIILHGTATLALAARELLDREAGGDPARLARIACRFGAMVIPGTTIQVRAAGDAPVDGSRAVFFTVTNAEGGPAIRDGIAIIRA